MTAASIQRETTGYWNLLKDLSDQVKLALIAMLEDSVSTPKQGARTAPTKVGYEMKSIDELSPVLSEIIGFAKPSVPEENDLNGDLARLELLTERLN